MALMFDGVNKLYMATGDMRMGFNMRDIYYDHEASCLVATDGMIIVVSKIEPKDSDCECSGYIPIDLVKRATEKKPVFIIVKKSTIEIEEPWKGEKLTLQRNDDGKRFPEWKKFMPEVDNYIEFRLPIESLRRIASVYGGDGVTIRIPAAKIGGELVTRLDKTKSWRVTVAGGSFQKETDSVAMGALPQAMGLKYSVREIPQEKTDGGGKEGQEEVKADGAGKVQGDAPDKD